MLIGSCLLSEQTSYCPPCSEPYIPSCIFWWRVLVWLPLNICKQRTSVSLNFHLQVTESTWAFLHGWQVHFLIRPSRKCISDLQHSLDLQIHGSSFGKRHLFAHSRSLDRFVQIILTSSGKFDFECTSTCHATMLYVIKHGYVRYDRISYYALGKKCLGLYRDNWFLFLTRRSTILIHLAKFWGSVHSESSAQSMAFLSQQ